MKFNINTSYNLDILNSLNMLTGDEFYTQFYEGPWESYGKKLSSSSGELLKRAVELNESSMLGPMLCLIVSSVPDFEDKKLIELMEDTKFLESCFERYPYYDGEKWPQQVEIIKLLRPVLEELEAMGFHEYWKNDRLTMIKCCQQLLRGFADKFQLQGELEAMLGPQQAFEDITLYICSFAAPHGMKLCGPRYVSDVRYSREVTLGIAIHEMFHPPYDAAELSAELAALGNDPLLRHAFDTKDPRYGYAAMDGFIEENVVEAMAMTICEKLGLEKDIMKYLAEHDGGSHKLSVVLVKYFAKYPKDKEQSFQEYFRGLMKLMPVGGLDKVYEGILAGEEI